TRDTTTHISRFLSVLRICGFWTRRGKGSSKTEGEIESETERGIESETEEDPKKMAMAMAKLVRGGCSAASSRTLLPAIRRHLGSSPATPATGVGRLMHTGLFRTPGVRSQEQLMRMNQFSGKRFMSSELPEGGRPPASFIALGASGALCIIMMLIAELK
ncbi:unnamed protein product, partial [Urochloa humidicola]